MDERVLASRQKTLIMPLIILCILGIVLFLPAGSLHFWPAWIYWSSFSALTLFITVYFGKRSPELLSRRMQLKEKATTKKPPAIYNLFFLCFIIPGLDFRFQWSSVPIWLIFAANAVVILGYLLIIRVFRENSYAATVIQVEKDQRVISTGPYALVRHPMYLGLVIMILFTPLALGSYWAILPALLVIPMNVYRIMGEEEVLRRELTGYTDYCLQTPYRLLPLIW